MSTSAEVFCSALGVAKKHEPTKGALEALSSELDDHLEVASLYWSGLSLPRDQVIEYVARVCRRSEPVATIEAAVKALSEIEFSDLYLCAGLATSDHAALKVFESAFGGEIERAVQRLDQSGDLADEVRQILRNKLLVAEPGKPLGIEKYLGRGPLGRWLWVMATREALMWLRRRRRETPLTDSHQWIADGDVELDYLKREYRNEFRRAFAEGMDELPSKERNLLHYHFVKRLTIDQVGAIYRVHRVTAFRWLRSARTMLVAVTRKRLAARLDIGPSEVDSIIRLVQSRLEVSVERVLPEP